MRFEFATATRILFGPGTVREVAPIAASLGRRALVVTGSTASRAASFIEQLNTQNVETILFSISSEPTITMALEGVKAGQRQGCDLVIGYGGGSVLDAAKAIAALMTNPGDPHDYLEVIGLGKPLVRPGAPCICVPTTAGTGSEVTRNAVLASPEHRTKVSLRSRLMLPYMAVVDSELTYSLPPSVTASTGLDALTQLIEPFVCNSPTPITDAICRQGIQQGALSLRRACEEGDNIKARESMALASLFGGLALTNAKLGAVHGLAAPLGGMFPIPHGVVCACLLPIVMEANLKALRARASDSPALSRYQEVAQLLTGRHSARSEDGFTWIQALCADLSVPRLASFGLSEDNISAVVAQAQKSNSMKGNPIPLTDEELTLVVKGAL